MHKHEACVRSAHTFLRERAVSVRRLRPRSGGLRTWNKEAYGGAPQGDRHTVRAGTPFDQADRAGTGTSADDEW